MRTETNQSPAKRRTLTISVELLPDGTVEKTSATYVSDFGKGPVTEYSHETRSKPDGEVAQGTRWLLGRNAFDELGIPT